MTNGQVIVKPEDVRKFAGQLKAFSQDLHNDSARLKAQFKQLGQTWRDREHERFQQEFEQATKVFQKFEKDANDYVAFLKRKARAAEVYLKQR